ncbi:Uncharacterised protein [Serratia quinivorans]|uniref:Uncharacterized protein n=1 Tax=Serratia quinivorans TaxID=137545 RepID=A0A379YBK7_9GAMM|nr:Uncharacterised protein [Serratia quinivorans]SPY75867.1 Uncharacterised protein [Providencia rustigianii]SUI43164.1 Uncharacterised protein [Serratia quinivorans]
MKKKAIPDELSLEQVNAIQIEAIKILLTGLVDSQFNSQQKEEIKVNVTEIFNIIDQANKMSPQPLQFWADGRSGIVETLNLMLPGCLDPKD